MMTTNDTYPLPGPTREEAHSARRAFLRSGPGALARVIGIPAVAAQIRANLPAPIVEETPISAVTLPASEPLFDLLDEGDEILMVADLPGVHADTLQISAADNTLSMQLCKAAGCYRYALPADVAPETVQWALRNGILEVRIQKLRALMLG